MAINEARHIGKRENVWFPMDEHQAMLDAMETIHEPNKSNFIRTAVKNFAAYIKEGKQ